LESKSPIPPRSLVTIRDSADPNTRDLVGQVLRIGYYSRQDGLECVWLVDKDGKYFCTWEQSNIYDDFKILELSDETDCYGADREILGPID